MNAKRSFLVFLPVMLFAVCVPAIVKAAVPPMEQSFLKALRGNNTQAAIEIVMEMIRLTSEPRAILEHLQSLVDQVAAEALSSGKNIPQAAAALGSFIQENFQMLRKQESLAKRRHELPLQPTKSSGITAKVVPTLQDAIKDLKQAKLEYEQALKKAGVTEEEALSGKGAKLWQPAFERMIKAHKQIEDLQASLARGRHELPAPSPTMPSVPVVKKEKTSLEGMVHTYELLSEKLNEQYMAGSTGEIERTIDEVERTYGVTGLKRLLEDLKKVGVGLGMQIWLDNITRRIQRREPGVLSEQSKPQQAPEEAVQRIEKTSSEQFRDHLLMKLKSRWSDCYIAGYDIRPPLDFCSGPKSPTLRFSSLLAEYAFKQDKSSLESAVKQYKIHLMPKDEDLERVTQQLFNAIASEPELKNSVETFKIKVLLESDHSWDHQRSENPPKIVIYTYGQAEAQKVLNNIYKIFGNQQGLDRAPNFNEKVTSLIYFAQGNRDDKFRLAGYFEQPNMVYFKSDVTGTHQNYHLINPNPAMRK